MVCTPNFEDLCARQKADDALNGLKVKDELQEDTDNDNDINMMLHDNAMHHAVDNGNHNDIMGMDDL
jgi:hypothetical protein